MSGLSGEVAEALSGLEALVVLLNDKSHDHSGDEAAEVADWVDLGVHHWDLNINKQNKHSEHQKCKLLRTILVLADTVPVCVEEGDVEANQSENSSRCAHAFVFWCENAGEEIATKSWYKINCGDRASSEAVLKSRSDYHCRQTIQQNMHEIGMEKYWGE